MNLKKYPYFMTFTSGSLLKKVSMSIVVYSTMMVSVLMLGKEIIINKGGNDGSFWHNS